METNTARNFALQLGSLIALYVSLGAVIAVVFGVINILHPDPLNSYWEYESAQQGIKFGIAMLVVFFPTYILLTRYVNQIRRKETGTYLTLTKWLVYLSLLVGGGILLGDFVAVILTYLNGEVTVRFILKALTLSVVIGGAFYYYIQDARGYWNKHEQNSKLYGAGAAILVIAVLALGFMNSASPEESRQMRFDQQQISDLSDIEWRIADHYRINDDTFPATIDELFVGITAPTAPEGRDAYTYRIVDEDTYELCATFAYSSDQSGSDTTAPMMFEGDSLKNPYNNWDHGVGETCFERTLVPSEKTEPAI